MPAYPLAFPTNVSPYKVRVNFRTAASSSTSPTTYKQQIYQHPGERWEIDVTIQKCTFAEATAWAQFLRDLHGIVGTFAFNLTPYLAGSTPDPGIVNFRLEDSKVGWDAEFGVLYDFSFRAVQDL